MPLNHVALAVSDRARSAAFYERFFGMAERVRDDDEALVLRSSDGSLLALSEAAIPVGVSAALHFGFELQDRDEVSAARNILRKEGVPELEWQDDDTAMRVQVADPDGYRVEFFAF
jgi:catechol 2,3-dioxygenase-like lactoylglutathione lyase family enzyme